jgi:hypothetical protein
VAGVAAYTLADVNAVIKINEIRKIIDAIPDQRLSGAIAFPNWLKQWRSHPDLRVAIHARLGRRNSGEM